MISALLAGCGAAPHAPPPPPSSFDGLPVSGGLEDALKAGFTSCLASIGEMRCRRDGVMFLGFGPFDAALDLAAEDGSGGFDQLTLWHNRDQNALIRVSRSLERQGWRSCFTGQGSKGDQAIFTRQDLPVRLSMDLSYFGKRRLRIIPAWNKREPGCQPGK